MGGDIDVESTEGVGTTFTMRLPAHVGEPQRPATGPTETDATAPLATGGMAGTALIIDDDQAARELLEAFFRKEGFAVAVATTGPDGLRMARELRPAIITLDVMMPGMDGWAVLTQLKAEPELAEIPVIMVTMLKDKSMGYTLGASDYLTKPIDRDRLATILNRYRSAKSPCQVLIVEDDPMVREMMCRMLKREGWLVAEAENGRVALERVAENRPELILLDLTMPEMDGFSFVRELRKNAEWRSIPVVVVTAKHVTEEDRSQLRGYVEKILLKGAYSREELLTEVRDLVLTRVSPLVGSKQETNV
jgi:CheY-like chemotaxis protein